MKKRYILALLAAGDKMPYELLREEDVSISYAYFMGNSFCMRLFRRFFLVLGLSHLLLLISLRKINLRAYDVILINENFYPLEIIKYVRQHNNKADIYYWLWNTLFSRSRRLYDAKKQWNNLLKHQKKYKFDIVSFDKEDCKKYRLIYNGQVVPFKNKKKNNVEKRDVFFGGIDKGRLPLLKKLAKTLNNLSISYKFWIVPDRKGIYSREDWNEYLHKNFLDYDLFLNYELESRCILEIVQKGQNGLTWRPIEALFYKKKLITNFIDIINYNFYNPNNVFILEKDDINNLPKFLARPYDVVDYKVIESYTFNSWIKRLLKEN